MEDDRNCSASVGLLTIAAAVLRGGRDPTVDDVREAFSHGLSRGRWHSNKQAFQAFLRPLEVKDDGPHPGTRIYYKGTDLAIPPAEQWDEIVMNAHGNRHFSARTTWQEVSLFCWDKQTTLQWRIDGFRAMLLRSESNTQQQSGSWVSPSKSSSRFCGRHAAPPHVSKSAANGAFWQQGPLLMWSRNRASSTLFLTWEVSKLSARIEQRFVFLALTETCKCSWRRMAFSVLLWCLFQCIVILTGTLCGMMMSGAERRKIGRSFPRRKERLSSRPLTSMVSVFSVFYRPSLSINHAITGNFPEVFLKFKLCTYSCDTLCYQHFKNLPNHWLWQYSKVLKIMRLKFIH